MEAIPQEPAPAPKVEAHSSATMANLATDAERQNVKQALHCAHSLLLGGDLDEALAVLRCECAEGSPQALGDAYHAVVEASLRNQRLETAVTALHEALRLGSERCAVKPASQDAVLRSLVQGHQHSRATEVLRSCCEAGMPPGDASFNSVIDTTVRARAYSEAWDVLEMLLASGRHADKYFISILTKSLETATERRWVRKGISLVDKFIEQQPEDVDEIVFNSLLNVLGHLGDMPKLRKTLAKMYEYGVAPSAVTYGTVVKAYGKAQDIDSVIKVWEDMRHRCLGVNPVTCGCVLDACVKCGYLDKAMSIFQEMRMQGLHKNTVLYATLIKGLAKVRDLVGACHLYEEMRCEGVPCNLVTYNSLMDVCVRCSDLRTAALFLKDMMQIGIEPDLITFSTLIKGYSHTGEIQKALALARELKVRGLRCDEIMYNSLIDGCAKANEFEEGMRVFEEMLRHNVAPSNITFSILVKLYFEGGRSMEAFQLVDDMGPRHRCVPNRVVYNNLLRCSAQHGGPALHRAAALVIELATRKNAKVLDEGMVSAVISGCAQYAEFETAASLIRELTGGSPRRGLRMVPVDCLHNLLKALGSSDQTRGEELLQLLRDRAVPPSQLAQLRTAFADGKKVQGCFATTAASGGNAAGGGGYRGVEQPQAWCGGYGYADVAGAGAGALPPYAGYDASSYNAWAGTMAAAGYHPEFPMSPEAMQLFPPYGMLPPFMPMGYYPPMFDAFAALQGADSQDTTATVTATGPLAASEPLLPTTPSMQEAAPPASGPASARPPSTPVTSLRKENVAPAAEKARQLAQNKENAPMPKGRSRKDGGRTGARQVGGTLAAEGRREFH